MLFSVLLKAAPLWPMHLQLHPSQKHKGMSEWVCECEGASERAHAWIVVVVTLWVQHSPRLPGFANEGQ